MTFPNVNDFSAFRASDHVIHETLEVARHVHSDAVFCDAARSFCDSVFVTACKTKHEIWKKESHVSLHHGNMETAAKPREC